MLAEPAGLRRLPPLAALTAAAAALAERLPAGPGRVAFAFENDTPAFVVALLASWARGLTVALPADARRYSVVPLLGARDNLAFLHDTGAGTGICVDAEAIDPAVTLAVALPWPGPVLACRATVTAHHERLQTADELGAAITAARQRLQLGPEVVVHHLLPAGHPAALVPGLLAPLQAGAAVCWGTGCWGTGCGSTGAAALREAVAAAGARRILTSAAALRNLLAVPLAVVPAGGHVVVFGDPLDPGTTAHCVAAGLRVEAWDAPHPVVARAVAAGSAHGAADVAVEALHVPGESAPRWFAGVLAAAPQQADALAAVAAVLPAAPLPPVVGATPRLRRDAAGAVPPGALPVALGRAADGAMTVPELPMAFTVAPDRVVAEVQVPAAHRGFAGHFATYAVMSGAVQLHDLLLPCLARLCGDRVVVRELHDLKFQARIGPGDRLTVEVVAAPHGSVQFTVQRDGVRCTSGRVVVAGATS